MSRINHPFKTGVAGGLSLAAIAPATAAATPYIPPSTSGPPPPPVHVVHVSSNDGFSRGDAGIGAVGGIGIATLAAASAIVARLLAPRSPRPRHAIGGTMRSKIAHAVLIALVGTGAYVSVALLFTSPASAESSSCAGPVTSAPTGPATVSAASTSFGRVLVVGSGPSAGCSLYLLTSDQLHALTGAPFACSDNANVRGKPCDAVLWPALLTQGAPIAGPGVNPGLLGTVTRTDLGLPGVPSVQQVTYAGLPLYRFFRDETPGETEGANLNDPVTTPAGIWYLLNPRGGIPATGQAELELETAPVDGTGPAETVLAARMNNDYSQFPNASFPVYTLSWGSGRWWGHVRRGFQLTLQHQRGFGGCNAGPEADAGGRGSG